MDLEFKGDHSASEVHVHPLGDPESGKYGNAEPSSEDQNSHNFEKTTEPHVILGYSVTPGRQDPGNPFAPIPPPTVSKQIGFFNANGKIDDIPYSNFKQVVQMLFNKN